MVADYAPARATKKFWPRPIFSVAQLQPWVFKEKNQYFFIILLTKVKLSKETFGLGFKSSRIAIIGRNLGSVLGLIPVRRISYHQKNVQNFGQIYRNEVMERTLKMNLTDALPSSFLARANSINSNFALIWENYYLTKKIFK